MSQTGSAQKRLGKEIIIVTKKDPIPGAKIELEKDNLFIWKLTIAGPKGTPFEKGNFKFRLEFPKEYPFHPPKAKSLQKVYHPSFDDEGNVCVDILRKESWSPMCGVREIVLAIEETLRNPNTDHPLNEEIAMLARNNKSQWEKTAKEWTKKYAS